MATLQEGRESYVGGCISDLGDLVRKKLQSDNDR